MQDLISKCWSKDPNERPSFKEIFDQLSSDFSFFDEDFDESEVLNYIEDLKESRKSQACPNYNEATKLDKTNKTEFTLLSEYIIDPLELKKGKLIGKGPHSECFITTITKNEKHPEIICAMKEIDVNLLRNHYDMKSVFNEIQLYASLKHKAILQLAFMHQNNIINRNLKSENILLDEN